MTRKHARKPQFFQNKLMMSAIAILVVLVVGYGGFAVHYQDHFLPGTKVYGVKLSGLSKAEATKKLSKKLKNNEFVLYDKNTKLAKITGKQLGVKRDFSKVLSERMDNQNPWLFQKNDRVQGAANTVEAFDSTVVDQFVKELFPKINDGRTVTKDAQIVNNKGDFVIKPEVNGNNFSEKKLQQVVAKSIQTGEEKIQLKDYYVKPTVTKDSAKIKDLKQSLEKLSQTKGTYTLAGETIKIPKQQIASWLKTEGTKISLDHDKAATYLNELNAKYSTIGKTRQFKTSSGGQVAVPAGTYGWSININAELENLTKDILAGKDFTREPVHQGSGYHKDGTDIGQTYVEVDKNSQHMWVYQNGQQVISTDIVTGKPGQDTPVGVFYVWSKERNATLRGNNDDGSKYASPVSYWMPIDYTGVGLHDSPWQPKYGGDWWVQHGSHGCVNTPPATMAKLFNTVETGTPVIVF